MHACVVDAATPSQLSLPQVISSNLASEAISLSPLPLFSLFLFQIDWSLLALFPFSFASTYHSSILSYALRDPMKSTFLFLSLSPFPLPFLFFLACVSFTVTPLRSKVRSKRTSWFSLLPFPPYDSTVPFHPSIPFCNFPFRFKTCWLLLLSRSYLIMLVGNEIGKIYECCENNKHKPERKTYGTQSLWSYASSLNITRLG